jgi:broad specificity phosphatase PhoE
MKTKKTNPPPTDLTTVYVHKYENYVGGGEICEGQENDSWPSHEPKQVDSGIEKVTLARAGLDYDTFDLVLPKDKTVWVVSVKYSTGDTFGSSHGHLAIAGVYATKDEADYVAETIQLTDQESNAGKWGRPEAKFDEATKARLKAWRQDTQYFPWEGYFESIESVDVGSYEVE